MMNAMLDKTQRFAKVEAQFREVINPVASLGFIGLATDRAGLRDFQAFVEPYAGVAIHPTRIPFAPIATPETLKRMEAHLTRSAELLVPGQTLHSISFSCTSGSIAIGLENVCGLIRSVRPEAKVVTPIGAVMKGLSAVGAKRISLLMPYLQETARLVANHFEGGGVTLDTVATFELEGDADINRVDPDCIFDEAVKLCHPESDALFISCTGWLTHPVVDRLERALGKPVITSNQALAWQALRDGGVTGQVSGRGALFAQH
jgi:maleate isomerase